jgi:carboxylesterase type B
MSNFLKPSLKDSQETLDCLRQLQPESFARIQHQLLKFFSYSEFDGVRIGPVADTWQKFPTLPGSLEDLMEEGRLPSVPIMIGLSAFEGFNPFLEFYLKLGANRKELLKDKQFIMDKYDDV